MENKKPKHRGRVRKTAILKAQVATQEEEDTE